MYQKVILLGVITGEPKMRFTPDGTAVTNFTLRTWRSWKPKGAEKPQYQTTFWKITVWKASAEYWNENGKDGEVVQVEGTVSPNESGNPRIWTGDDGVPRASYEVTAMSIQKTIYRKGQASGAKEDEDGDTPW